MMKIFRMVRERMERNSSQGIDPLVHLGMQEEEKNEGSQTAVKNLRGIRHRPSASQDDLWRGYQERLRYDVSKAQIDLEKTNVANDQKIAHERKVQDLKVWYSAFMKMISGSIYRDAQGRLIYAIVSPDETVISAKRLLNVDGFGARILISYYPDVQMAFQVFWGEEGNETICFRYTEEGISPNDFLKRLKSHGVLLLVSGRTEKEAANVLLAYSFCTAERTEIPFTYGWGKRSDGSWHYAQKGELVLKEVLGND